jgi:hypothetical protein
MKLTRIYKLIFLSGIVFFAGITAFSVSAQDRLPLEEVFFSKQFIVNQQQNVLDSLNQELIIFAQKIDAEKSKKEPDNQKLSGLMSSALTLSKRIEIQQKNLTIYEEQAEKSRRQLDKFYQLSIDSLQVSEIREKSQLNRQRILKQIGLFSEKRILISPPIPSLSFDPKEVLKLTLKDNASSLEKGIYRDYLTKAASEITSHIEYLQSKRIEIEDISKLQDKASRFMKDVQSDDKLSVFGQISRISSTGQRTESSAFTNTDLTGNSGRSSFNVLLRQLDMVPAAKIDFSSYADYNSRNREFIAVLAEAEQRLKEYKQQITIKLTADNGK